MQPRFRALADIMRGRSLVPLLVIVLCLCGAQGAFAQREMPRSSDAIASQLTNLLKSITGAGTTKAKPAFRRTRFVIELERAAQFEVFSLVNPNRVVLQLPSMRMMLPDPDAAPPGKSAKIVTAIRAGKSGPKRTRIVIGVATPVVVENAHVVPSADGRRAELRLDMVPVKVRPTFANAAAATRISRTSASLGARKLQPPVPRKAASLDHIRRNTHKYTIVVDPGHGGHDSGAKKHGIQEKNVVLAFGLMLRKKLEATGRYRVLMTRDTDRFITLSGRRDFADRKKADLFISVHADYAKSNASGATIYSLRKRLAERLKKSKGNVRRAELLSKREVGLLKASPASSNPSMLREILSDLAWRDVKKTAFDTKDFSATVIKYMGQSTELRRRPHQTAAFRVLKTAKMPAVLIELAYVSNRRDAKRLKSRTWRNKVSSSIVTAVNNYFADGIRRLPIQ